MTRKDFEVVAKALKYTNPRLTKNHEGHDQEAREALWDDVFFNMVNELEKTNSNFKFDVFSKACGRAK